MRSKNPLKTAKYHAKTHNTTTGHFCKVVSKKEIIYKKVTSKGIITGENNEKKG
jgi:hypothetical protein